MHACTYNIRSLKACMRLYMRIYKYVSEIINADEYK